MGNTFVIAHGLKVDPNITLNHFFIATVLDVYFNSLFSDCLSVFQIWRVNTKYNVLYVHGSVPGHRNCVLKVKIITHIKRSVNSPVNSSMFHALTATSDLAPVKHCHTCKIQRFIFIGLMLDQQCVCLFPWRNESTHLNDVSNIPQDPSLYSACCSCLVRMLHSCRLLFVWEASINEYKCSLHFTHTHIHTHKIILLHFAGY